ncbi:hypothetical protein EG329_012773 [Mollisiaceae sp. DMI_Dod_QoI]|nr:hypothetical protein EG329_012773 [Helotiales sp. DMI_Dod_QoI]
MPSKMSDNAKQPASLPNLCEPQEIIKVTVSDAGSGEKDCFRTYSIYKAVLCHHSPFFAAAFNGPSVEAYTKAVTFSDIDAYEFGYFVHWVYYGVLVDKQDQCSLPFELRIQLWNLGERFQMPELQNDMMESLHIMLARPCPTTWRNVLLAIEEFKSTSILRQLLLDGLLVHFGLNIPTEFWDMIPWDTRIELAESFDCKTSKLVVNMPPKEKYLVETNKEMERRPVDSDPKARTKMWMTPSKSISATEPSIRYILPPPSTINKSSEKGGGESPLPFRPLVNTLDQKLLARFISDRLETSRTASTHSLDALGGKERPFEAVDGR